MQESCSGYLIRSAFEQDIDCANFFAGLLPVVGNLISNTAIFITSLSISPAVAVASG